MMKLWIVLLLIFLATSFAKPVCFESRQKFCKNEDKVYIIKTDSCEFLNPTKYYDGCGATKPVPDNYWICIKNHSIDANHFDAFKCPRLYSDEDPCEYYGLHNKNGKCKHQLGDTNGNIHDLPKSSPPSIQSLSTSPTTSFQQSFIANSTTKSVFDSQSASTLSTAVESFSSNTPSNEGGLAVSTIIIIIIIISIALFIVLIIFVKVCYKGSREKQGNKENETSTSIIDEAAIPLSSNE